jgi:phosphoribosylamine--glycine ligase
VLGVTALGSSVKDAQTQAYTGIECIDWPEGFYRSDIGWRAVDRA